MFHISVFVIFLRGENHGGWEKIKTIDLEEFVDFHAIEIRITCTTSISCGRSTISHLESSKFALAGGGPDAGVGGRGNKADTLLSFGTEKEQFDLIQQS